MSAARGVWLLLYFSHEKVCMLDGGFEKWKKEGYPIEVKSNPLKCTEFKGESNNKILATDEGSKEIIKQEKCDNSRCSLKRRV